jgi:hypothetical protein
LGLISGSNQSALCFALELEEQKRGGFHYQYSNYQIEYSRNLIFSSGREMDEVFQALIDRSRVLLDIQKVGTFCSALWIP